ncbi:MAG: glutamate--tRNA ligase [Alphaproteobacteria bacterium]|nr:glutamate--tRNA ligase [Alphaproteobacteria bacterium]
MTVITRFAPSPTGYLHIGGARTALFNYLFARHHGGQFKLRIEDTDVARSTDAAKQALIEGLDWMGVRWDGEIVYQLARAARHREVAEELVKNGAAYYCYTTPEELAEQRAAAEAKGEIFKYDRKWRDRTDSVAGVKPSVRIKAPLTGEVIVKDLVQGDVTFGADVLDDFVILRSDGTPTYMHAVVVDDHDMGITHIIRGDDHLNNAGRQMVIYQAMGWDVPAWAHIPLIHGPDGAKLSKRHGATAIGDYAGMGYLPEAMRNYLLRLGWSHGDDEIISDTQAIEWFNIEGIGQSPSRLDFAKLNHVNAHYMRAKSGAELAQLVGMEAQWAAALDSVKSKASTLTELNDAMKFYLERPTSYDDKAKATLEKGKANLPMMIGALEALGDWNAAAIKAAITAVAEANGKKLGEVMPPMRAAIVGAMSGPDIPDAIAILGKTEALTRLKAAL